MSGIADWMTVYPDKFLDLSVRLFCKYQWFATPSGPEWRDVSEEHLLGHASKYRFTEGNRGSLSIRDCFNYRTARKSGSIRGGARFRGNRDFFAERRDWQVATATLEAHLPERVTIDKIVELRQSANEERLMYQTAIASIVDEVEKISSAGELDRVARRAKEPAKSTCTLRFR